MAGSPVVIDAGIALKLVTVNDQRLKRAAAYDSYYLALAESLNCDLWTTDSRLVNAVKLRWVRLVG
jgi:hypothetical protein